MNAKWLCGMLILLVSGGFAWAGMAEENEVEVKLDACPAAVQKTFKREAGGATLDEIEKEIENGTTVYEANVILDGKEYEIEVAEDGTLLEKALEDDEDAVEEEQEADDDKEQETEMKLADCPAAVQKTLKREAGGATLDDIEKETEGGKTVYEAEVEIDGKDYEIEVAEDGTLLSKSLEED